MPLAEGPLTGALRVSEPPARYARRMGYDDDWPPPLEDPEEIKQARENARSVIYRHRAALRYVYAGLGILLILVIVLALTR